MELYYATSNVGKVISLQREFSPDLVKIVRVPIEIPEPRSDDVRKVNSILSDGDSCLQLSFSEHPENPN